MGNNLLRLSIKLNLPVHGIVKSTLYNVFVGGESLQDCKKIIKAFEPHKVGIVPDFSVEAKGSNEEFDMVTAETLRCIELCAENKEFAPFTVFKMTGLARFELLEKLHNGEDLSKEEQLEADHLQDRVERICAHCHKHQVRVFFDAEETWIQRAIDDLAYKMMAKYNTEKALIFNTYQMYRKDGLDRIKAAHLKAATHNFYLGAKLVRGAYMEKERNRAAANGYDSPINTTKEATDDTFNRGLNFCLNEKQRIYMVAATHNEHSCAYLVAMMHRHGLKPEDDRVWFSQLHGMSNNLTFNLAAAGYNAVKYLPYGPVKETVPYLIRRSEENSSAFNQSPRELVFIRKEMQRRGLL